MANSEHVYWLREGVEAWNRWRLSHPDVLPDLELMDARGLVLDSVNFRRAMLRGANFSNVPLKSACFSGADLAHANLTATDMSGTDCSGSNLEEAILRDANLFGADLTKACLVKADLSRAQLSNAKCAGCRFTSAVLNQALLVETCLQDAELSGVQARQALFRRAELARADLRGSMLCAADFSGAIGTGANLSEAECDQANFENCNLTRSIIRRTKLSRASLTGSDLSDALVDSVDFANVNLTSVVLFGCKITNPLWMFRAPIASWSGSLVIQDPVPTHPIQDVQGLPPALRRSIADAQYLVEVEKRVRSSRLKSGLFRLWGISSAFGQSLTRWSCVSLTIALGFALAFTRLSFAVPEYTAIEDKSDLVHDADQRERQDSRKLVDDAQDTKATLKDGVRAKSTQRLAQSTTTLKRPKILDAFCLSIVIFTTLGFSDMTPVSGLGRGLIALEVTVGYLMLGALLALLTNKFARLS